MVYLQWCLVVTWLVPRDTVAVSAQICVTIKTRISLQSYFSHSYIRRVHVCLAVTYHLYLWQNDRDLSRTSAVTVERIPK